ncbi:hypothetical protein ACWED2_12385 [Amycolatopsis sp. NPDC005003]
MTGPDLLIDHFLPHPHFELARHLIVDAPGRTARCSRCTRGSG